MLVLNPPTAVQIDYDLYFSDPYHSSASQVVPFYTTAPDSLTLAMWVQFAQKDDTGIFITLYSAKYVQGVGEGISIDRQA